MKQAIEKVLNSLKQRNSEAESMNPVFHDHRYRPFPYDDDNFHEITSEKSMKIAFVDGGSAELVSSPDFSLGFVRTYFCIFDGNRKLNPGTQFISDFYVAAYSFVKNGEIFYETKLFPLDESLSRFLPSESDLFINSEDPTVRNGIFSMDIANMTSITRKFAEWKIMEMVIDNFNIDMIVKDGILQTGITNEKNYAERVFEKAVEKNIITSGIAKRSSLFTESGKSLITALAAKAKFMKLDKWFYYPVAEINRPDHKADIFITKLHENAKNVFRLEIFNHQADRHAEAISALARNSCDYRFPGYPYGLLDADKFARISEDERKFHQTVFSSFSIKDNDAHKILNRVFQ